MNWAAGWYLIFVLPVLALVLVVAFMGRRHRKRLASAFGAGLYEQILPSSVRMRRTLAATAVLVGLGLVAMALAEPRFDKQIRTVQATGVDLVLVLDLSRSMDAQDVEPSRLERARREITDLFRVLQGDRVGLVVYAGDAWPRLPLTEDLGAVQLVLSELDTGVFEAQGSALGAAIREGVTLLGGGDGSAGKALLVLSDGEIHEGDDALAAAAEAAEAGVTIYAMGIGEEAARVPMDGGWMAYNGEPVISTPDDSVLREVAKATGGAYVHSVASPQDVVGLYEGEMRRKLTAVVREARQREVWRSAYQWPLGIGLGLLLIGAWLGDGRRPLGAAAGLLLVLAALGQAAPAMANTVAEADEAYRTGRYVEAAKQLTELSLEHPGDATVFDRLGAARYRAGDYEGAARAWDSVRQLTGGGDIDATYNAGNAHWRAGRLEQAADRFSEVLGKEPLHEQARTNAEILAAELQARREMKPPPPPAPKNEGDDEENKDGGGDPDEDPSEAGEGDQQPKNGGESEEERPEGDSDPDAEPDGDGEAKPDLADLEENPDGEEGDQQAAGGAPTDQEGEGEQITAGQADRLLDGVEEGMPKLRKRGTGGGKPW